MMLLCPMLNREVQIFLTVPTENDLPDNGVPKHVSHRPAQVGECWYVAENSHAYQWDRNYWYDIGPVYGGGWPRPPSTRRPHFQRGASC